MQFSTCLLPGYYLEVLLALGPFCKEPLNAVLQGVTHHDLDVSVDKVKAAALPVLLKFILVDDGLELKVVRRGKILLPRLLRKFPCLGWRLFFFWLMFLQMDVGNFTLGKQRVMPLLQRDPKLLVKKAFIWHF